MFERKSKAKKICGVFLLLGKTLFYFVRLAGHCRAGSFTVTQFLSVIFQQSVRPPYHLIRYQNQTWCTARKAESILLLKKFCHFLLMLIIHMTKYWCKAFKTITKNSVWIHKSLIKVATYENILYCRFVWQTDQSCNHDWHILRWM